MESRLTDLEIRYTHLERQVADLSEVVFAQQRAIDGLLRQLTATKADIAQLGAPMTNDRPPHYGYAARVFRRPRPPADLPSVRTGSLVRALRGRTLAGMLARSLILSGLAAFAVSGRTASAQERQDQWSIAPEPSWVAPAPTAPTEQAPPDESVLEYLLDDTQERVTAKTVERYRHIRFRPRSPAQVEDGSQVELDFNPAFERLVIHHVRVERDGRALAALTAREVKLVQREKGFEERIYDGTLSALVFLHDVRVGDVVDYAYSVEGANPVLGGKYVTAFPVADQSYTAS